MTEVRIAHSYWQQPYISRRINRICRLCTCICTNHDILLKLYHATLAWRWCLVRRWPPVAVWGVYRHGWALGHDLGGEGEENGEIRKRKKENKGKKGEKSWRERRVGRKRGENGVNKGKEYTTWLVMGNRKSICSGLTFQWVYDLSWFKVPQFCSVVPGGCHQLLSLYQPVTAHHRSCRRMWVE